MTDNVVQLGETIGTIICSVNFFRRPDGSIHANLIHMPEYVIENKASICDRFFLAAQCCVDGTLDLMRQGLRFDEETRAMKEEQSQ